MSLQPIGRGQGNRIMVYLDFKWPPNGHKLIGQICIFSFHFRGLQNTERTIICHLFWRRTFYGTWTWFRMQRNLAQTWSFRRPNPHWKYERQFLGNGRGWTLWTLLRNPFWQNRCSVVILAFFVVFSINLLVKLPIYFRDFEKDLFCIGPNNFQKVKRMKYTFSNLLEQKFWMILREERLFRSIILSVKGRVIFDLCINKDLNPRREYCLRIWT